MARLFCEYSSLMVVGFATVLGCSGSKSSGAATSGGSTGAATASVGVTTGATTTTTTAGSAGGGTTTVTTSTSTTASGAGGAGGMATTGSTTSSAGGMGSSGVTSGAGGNPGDVDADKDGWTVNQGDCCDTVGKCANPELVNPGAFEYLGNGIDDDCDPSTPDNVPTKDCSPAALVAPTSSDDLIKAMDLCQFTTESPPLPMKKWGVISTELLLADGSTPLPPSSIQVGVLADYGTAVFPKGQNNLAMAALSSGAARDANDPGFVHPKNGGAGQIGSYNAMTQANIPPAYLAQHGGKPPSPANCPACTMNCGTAYDSVNLKARIRVPTNAFSFSYNLKFYSAEFPEFLCQQYNDFFITLLKSQWLPDPNKPAQMPLPPDGNIAKDAQGNPISVNNAFFEVCFPPAGFPPGSCPGGTLELAGTGMGGWGNNVNDGGGTVWLTNDSPVVPGETIEIQFIIWDAGDHNVDSLVLLDRFRWKVTPSGFGVHL